MGRLHFFDEPKLRMKFVQRDYWPFRDVLRSLKTDRYTIYKLEVKFYSEEAFEEAKLAMEVNGIKWEPPSHNPILTAQERREDRLLSSIEHISKQRSTSGVH